MTPKKLTMRKFLTSLLVLSGLLIVLPKILSYFLTDKSMPPSFIMLLIWHMAVSNQILDLSDRLKKVILIWGLSSIVLTISFVIGLVLCGEADSLIDLVFLLLYGFLLSLFCILMFLPTAVEYYEKQKPSTSGYKKIFWARLCSFITILLLNIGIIGVFSYAIRVIVLRRNIEGAGAIVVLLFIGCAFPLAFTVWNLLMVIRYYKKMKTAVSSDKTTLSEQLPDNNLSA